MSSVEPFSFSPEQVAPGIHLLEASAGTGKTFTIEGLVLHHLAAPFTLGPEAVARRLVGSGRGLPEGGVGVTAIQRVQGRGTQQVAALGAVGRRVPHQRVVAGGGVPRPGLAGRRRTGP